MSIRVLKRCSVYSIYLKFITSSTNEKQICLNRFVGSPVRIHGFICLLLESI